MSDQKAVILILCGIDGQIALSGKEQTMNPPKLKPVVVPGKEDESPAPSLRSIVRKSALLNVVIVLTSAPVLIFEGGPKAVVVTLKIMVGISVLIWAATFALFFLLTLPWIFRTPVSLMTRRDPPYPAGDSPVDDWSQTGVRP
jgi:hypothetical protein